jgi:signal transduction histidine kinase
LSQAPIDFLNLFVRPPGDLIYFLAVIAISQSGLFMALGERLRQPQSRAAGRYVLTTLGILLAWVILMLGALFALVSNQGAANILPPLERAAQVIGILIVGWAFLTADHDRWGRLPNVVLLMLMLVVIAGYITTGTVWPSLVGKTDFNTAYGVTWTFIPVILAGLGAILIILYFPLVTDAPLKLVYFLIVLAGNGLTLFQIAQGTLAGDYAGPARLAFLAAMPILPAVIYRMVVSHLQAELIYQTRSQPIVPIADILTDSPAIKTVPEPSILAPSSNAPAISPMQRDSVQLLKTLGLILEDATPANIPERIVSSGLDVLKADVGAILALQDANYADVTAAYDGVNKSPIRGMALNLDNQPTLVNAIERRLQRPLYPDRNVEELRDLYTRLDINDIGPAYLQPLMSGKELIAVLMVGMPYSKRELEENERELLKGVGIIAGNLLGLSFAAQDARLKAEERAIQALVQGVPLDAVQDDAVFAARQEIQASLQLSREQIAELSRQVTQLKIELDYERSKATSGLGDTQEGLSVSQRLLALNDELQMLRDERERVVVRLQEAETTLAGATATDNESVLKTMVEVLRREKDELQAQRENLQAQLDELRANNGQAATPQLLQDVIDHMSQEKSRMEAERDRLSSKLGDIETQLKALGIENGTAGLAQLISQLTEHRATLQARVDALLAERAQMQENIDREKERETRIQTLQLEIKHLASDREATTRQRDQLRIERDELVAKLEATKQNRARLLAESSAYQLELAEAHQIEAKLRIEIQQLADERSYLINLRDQLGAEKQALETERNQLLARSEGNRDRLQQIGEDGVGSLTKMIQDVSEQRSQLERELNETRTTLATVQNQLNMLQVSTKSQPQNERPENYNPELILGTVQELRTPLTSIVGYIDLLLDESAGILGKMQRDFLQRVAANVNRLTMMLEDLTRLAALETSRFGLSPELVDVVHLIEEAISNSTYQFREKSLVVHLNLDDHLPSVRADRDALTQIIGQLLANAYLASPTNSQVFVTAHRQEIKLADNQVFAMPTDSVLISVEDRGGGMSSEDVPRVFARKYKADNPLIQGLGDTGVGLSIAKTLAEAHGGGLWVETREGVGSIFYFALPINPILEAEG